VAETLAFIGAGRIGTGVAQLAVAAGLDVVLSNSRGPASLAGLVSQLGPHARAATPAEAAAAAEVVVATIPLEFYAQLPADALAGKIVIDTMNYYADRDGHIADLDAAVLTSSELVQRHLADSRVVKAFNNIDFRRLVTLARPPGSAMRSALPVAGDDEQAKARVARLLDTLGYDAVDAGRLARSWRCEPGTPVYVEPYSSPRPERMDQEQLQRWFLDPLGVVLPADQVKRLCDGAVRRQAGDARAVLA
jgi:predicted dinucleotide-binding enzyme